MRQVRQRQHQLVQFGLDAFELLLAGVQLGSHAVDVGEQRRDVFAALLGLADGFGARVALGLQLLGAGLHGLALCFQRLDTRHVQLITAGSQAIGNVLQLCA